MAGAKLSPRQKMISMMYLVLTALLALNISKEILNAFVTINASLEKTNEVFANKNEAAYAAFEKALAENQAKVKPWYDKAMRVKDLSKELVDHIDNLKLMLIKAVEKPDPSIPDDSLNLRMVGAKDNYDISTNLLIGSEPARPKDGPNTARELRRMILDFRENLLAIVPDHKKASIDNLASLDLPEMEEENKVMLPWESKNFDHIPLAAVITRLSQLQTDIRNAEADVVKILYSEVDAGDFKFDAITARVIAPTSYVTLGDTYRADVFVAAYSTTQNPEVLVGTVDTATNSIKGEPIVVPVQDGVGKYAVKTTSEGFHTWGGIIKVKAPDGTVQSYPFSGEYIAAKPALVVSPTKMNVLYIGVDNPLDVSVSGFPAERINPSISGGSLSGSKGKYIARVSGGTKATVNVSVKMDDGSSRSMGSVEFRVKRIPDPVAKFGGKKGTANISKGDLMAAAGVIADMENFDFDVKVEVLGFKVVATIGGYEQEQVSSSNRLTEAQKNLLKNVKPGQRVFIEGVRARLPDGITRELPPISLKVV